MLLRERSFRVSSRRPPCCRPRQARQDHSLPGITLGQECGGSRLMRTPSSDLADAATFPSGTPIKMGRTRSGSVARSLSFFLQSSQVQVPVGE